MNIETYIQQSLEGLKEQTTAHTNTWNLGRDTEWRFDLTEGTLRWFFEDGTVASAPMQVIGTYNPDSKSFLWGWDHPSVPAPLRAHAQLVKDFGEEHGMPTLTTPEVECTENEAWEFTAVAARLAGANGAYRGDAGGPLVYMTFGQVTLFKPQ